MFFVDDVAMAPFQGLLWIAKEIQSAVIRAEAAEEDEIRARLSELYMQLETGRIDEGTFDDLEAELLDRLDVIEEKKRLSVTDEASDEEDADEEEDEDADQEEDLG